MAGPIRKLVQLVLDRRAANRMEKDATRSLSTIDKGLGKVRTAALRVGAAIASAFAFQALVRFGKELFKLGLAVEETANKFNTTFGESADLLDAFLVDFTQVAGLTKTEGREMAATAGAIAQGLGFAVDASSEFSARILQLAGDLASFNNVPIEETFNALRSGLTGETEPLKRFGIVLRQDEVNMRALMATGKRLASELTQQELAAARLTLVYEKAGVALGDLERTQGSTANRLRQFTAAWRELKEAIGFAIVGASEADSLLERMTITIRRLTEWVDRNHGSFEALADVLRLVARALLAVVNITNRTIEILTGGLTVALGAVVKAFAGTTRSVVGAGNAVAWFFELVGRDKGGRAIREFVAETEAAALEWERLADAMIKVGMLQGRGLLERPRPARPERQPFSFPAGGAGSAEGAASATEQATKKTKKAKKANEDLTVSLGAANQILVDQQHELRTNATLSALLGSEYDALGREASTLMLTMQALADLGIGPADVRMQGLAARLRDVQEQARRSQDQLELMGGVASAVGDVVAGALGAGIGEMAAQKAKQNAIMAAEQLAMALVAALNPVTAAKAPLHLTAAGKFAAISAAWGALAGATGGFSGGGSAGGAASAGTGQAQAQAAQPAGAEIHVYFEGPGFDAVNPQVQRIVAGAIELHRERAGNAVVKIHRNSRSTTA
jgi:hypothetical protein